MEGVREVTYWEKPSAENLTQWRAASSHSRVVDEHHPWLLAAAFSMLSFRAERRYLGGVYIIVQRNPIMV